MAAILFSLCHYYHLYVIHHFVCVCAACLADVAWVLDTSGSINIANPDNFNLMLNFINLLVQSIEFGANGAIHSLVQFGNLAYNRWYLNTYTKSKRELLDAVGTIAYFNDNQQTNTQSALNKV
jgi:hypothetical protein